MSNTTTPKLVFNTSAGNFVDYKQVLQRNQRKSRTLNSGGYMSSLSYSTSVRNQLNGGCKTCGGNQGKKRY